MKILVVEDEKLIALLIRKILEKKGHKVTICSSVEEAEKNKYDQSHDFMTLDLMLPGKPGSAYVKEVRQKKNKIPILMLSAVNSMSTKTELLNLGANDYMTKPFEPAELINRIEAIYKKSQQEDGK